MSRGRAKVAKMKIPEKDNQLLVSLIESLVKTKKPFWRKVAEELSRPKKKRAEVNLSKIEHYAMDNSTVIVPGKVLAAGALSKKVTVAAFSFSGSAKQLIDAVGGKSISIESLHKSNPDGKGVMILK